jgi:peptidyl-prolyl cis-trans isomerase SurA
LEFSSQGGSIKDITRCQMLGKLLEDKLYAHQAIQDSVKVTDAEVKGLLEDRDLHGGPNRFYGQSS